LVTFSWQMQNNLQNSKSEHHGNGKPMPKPMYSQTQMRDINLYSIHTHKESYLEQ